MRPCRVLRHVAGAVYAAHVLFSPVDVLTPLLGERVAAEREQILATASFLVGAIAVER